jgi:hypothetical protein
LHQHYSAEEEQQQQQQHHVANSTHHAQHHHQKHHHHHYNSNSHHGHRRAIRFTRYLQPDDGGGGGEEEAVAVEEEAAAETTTPNAGIRIHIQVHAAGFLTYQEKILTKHFLNSVEPVQCVFLNSALQRDQPLPPPPMLRRASHSLNSTKSDPGLNSWLGVKRIRDARAKKGQTVRENVKGETVGEL